MQINSIFQGKYKIIKQLGKGGMGSVYLARNINLGNSFWAIKKIKKTGSKINVKAEQKILTKLNHPSIIKIIDVAEDSNYIYLIEEYVDGRTLLGVIHTKDKNGKTVGPNSVDEEIVIEWAKQIVGALDYLHTRKPYPIIYRDLKLDNIMLDSNGKIKIIDFGIAKQYDGGDINESANALTYLYAAPEQESRGEFNFTTDIYSLGVVLYILALGKKIKIAEIFNKRAKKKVKKLLVRPMRELNPNLSIGLTRIIEKCLEQKPEKRYQNTKELLIDLNNIYRYDSTYKALVRRKYITIASTIILLASFTVLTSAGIKQLGVEKIERYDSKIQEGQNLIFNGDYEMAVSSFKEAIKIMPKKSEGYINIAKMYFQIGEYDECINYLEGEALLKESSLYKEADCLYILGSSYYKKEEYSSAITRFEKAVILNPTSVNYLRDLAVSYAKNGNIEKAKETLEKLSNEKAQEDVTNYVKGEILLKENNIEEAINSFNLSLEVASNDEIKSKSIISIAETYRDYAYYLGNDSINKQIEVLEKAEKVLDQKNNLVTTEMLAKAYYDKAINDDSKEFYKKSIDSFNKLLSLGYKRPYVYRNIAIIYQQQLNDYQSAEETLLKMNEIYPQDVGCYTQLSLLNIEIENNKAESNRNYEKANGYYEQALKYSNGEYDSSLQQLRGLIGELKSKGWIE